MEASSKVKKFPFIDLFKLALHVSGDKLAHLQEHFLTVYTAFGTIHRYCCQAAISVYCTKGSNIGVLYQRQQYRCIVPKATISVYGTKGNNIGYCTKGSNIGVLYQRQQHRCIVPKATTSVYCTKGSNIGVLYQKLHIQSKALLKMGEFVARNM